MSGDITAVFVLPRFRLLATEVVDKEVVLSMETPRRPVGCPASGAVARVKDRRPVTVRDLPSGGTLVILKWRKSVFKCQMRCARTKTWNERNDAVAPRAVLAERARQWAFQQVGFGDRSVSTVAGELGVAWHTIMTPVNGREKPVVDDPDRLAGVRAPACQPRGTGPAMWSAPRHRRRGSGYRDPLHRLGQQPAVHRVGDVAGITVVSDRQRSVHSTFTSTALATVPRSTPRSQQCRSGSSASSASSGAAPHRPAGSGKTGAR